MPDEPVCDDQEERVRAMLAERGVVVPDIEFIERTAPDEPLAFPIMVGPVTVEVQVTMTVEVESLDEAVEGAWRWLLRPRELPLSCSDGVTLRSVEVRRAAG